MAGVFAKAKNLLSQKNYAELRQKVIFYLRYMALRFWFFCTGKEWDSNLKKTKKHWITYTYLNPVASVGPGCYILWQNTVNAIQLFLSREGKLS